VSDRNVFLKRCLAADPALTVGEWRLAAALDLCILGFAKGAERIGDKLLREESHLHGRSMEEAREGLLRKGIVLRFEKGKRGRGYRSLYILFEEEEKTGEGRAFASPEKTAEKTGKKTGPGRARSNEVRNTPQPPNGGPVKISKKDLCRFTGSRWTRGSHGGTYVYDPLGTETPPRDWPHERPSREEIVAALEAQDELAKEQTGAGGDDERRDEDALPIDDQRCRIRELAERIGSKTGASA
jgi:hypothetical protein